MNNTNSRQGEAKEFYQGRDCSMCKCGRKTDDGNRQLADLSKIGDTCPIITHKQFIGLIHNDLVEASTKSHFHLHGAH